MDPQQLRMLKKIRQGRSVLFLGAGASSGANAPSGDQLSQMVHQEFLAPLPQTSPDLMDVCSAVLDTPGIDRSAVEDFIRKKLDVQPSAAHLQLGRNRWQAIFTTNFDDLVETAYRVTPDRLQRCEPVLGRDFSRTQSDYLDVLRLFKLMGSVDGSDEDSRMVLSRTDYNRKLRKRGGLFKLLYDFVKDGTIVYVGYSFRDRLGRDIIDEVVEEVGLERLPWAWALLPTCDPATEQMLRQRRVLPLAMTFEQFISKVLEEPAVEGEAARAPALTVTVAGIPVDIPEADVKMYLRQFDFVHDATGARHLDDETKEKRDFLEGKTDPWIGVARGWAFRRPALQDLRSELVKQLRRPLEREVPVVLVTGPAGSGKTMLARVAVHGLYKDEGLPCILLRPEREQLDSLVVDSFARGLAAAVAAVPGTPSRLPIVIVVDEAATKLQDLRRLSQFLVSRGILAVILALARENEWKVAQSEHPFKPVSTIPLPDDLARERDEPASLVRHLRSLGVLLSPHDDSYWVDQVNREYQNSFQTTLYYLAEPTRPPISQSIRSEFDRLMPLAKRAYRHVSIFYQFGIPLDLELLARSLACSYEEFIDSVYDPASIGVIIDDQASPDTIRFRARSRMVAEQVILYAYGDPFAWLPDLTGIVGSLLPQNANEVESIRTLLIRLSGKGGAQPYIALADLKPVFEAAFTAGMHDSVTLHHFALLLRESEDFEGAERFLREAMAVLDDTHELTHFKSASRQHLYNSMGVVSARHGLQLEKLGQASRAQKQFEHAVEYFRSARSGFFPNAYPYYSEAWMLYSRARNSSGGTRLQLLAGALQVLDESDGNVAEDEKASLQEIEAKIVQLRGTIPGLKDMLIDLAREGDVAGQYLQARLEAGLYTDGYDIRSAYSIVTAALEVAPNHLPCLRLASRLHLKMNPDDWQGWWGLLTRRYQLEGTRGDCGLLFDLGFAACQLGKYSEAAKYFGQLDDESTGHPMRSGVVRVVADAGKPRRFTARVKLFTSRFEAWLQSDALSQEVKCIPAKQKFTVATGQTVTFTLALNYRGFLAIDLRPE